MRITMLRFLAAGLLFALCPTTAQEFRATITGRGVDSSQAAVAGAAVEVRNVALLRQELSGGVSCARAFR